MICGADAWVPWRRTRAGTVPRSRCFSAKAAARFDRRQRRLMPLFGRSPAPPAARSVASSSRSGPWSGSACAGSRSQCLRLFPTRMSSRPPGGPSAPPLRNRVRSVGRRRSRKQVGSARCCSHACWTLSQLQMIQLIRISENFWRGGCSSISCHIAGASYRAGKAGAQATAQSERIRPWLVANRFQAISQASMMSARLRNTELASQWLRK